MNTFMVRAQELLGLALIVRLTLGEPEPKKCILAGLTTGSVPTNPKYPISIDICCQVFAEILQLAKFCSKLNRTLKIMRLKTDV